MNSAEEISRYKETTENYYSPTLSRRLLGYGYDLPEKSPKKEKKWSLGSLFRRKKREESDSSSEEECQKKGFLNRRRKKSDKKKKGKSVGTFDHVVISRNSHLYRNGHEEGVLSDPTGGFNNYTGRAIPHISNDPLESKKTIKDSPESLDDLNNSKISLQSGSADSLAKKNKKILAKIRAETRRIKLRDGSSSDEDSQRSASSSRLRSDESISGVQRDGATSRRSRASRTERYLRRHSKDNENLRDPLKQSKSDAENSALNWKLSDDSNRSLSRSPLVPPMLKAKTSYSSLSSQSPSISGLSTIPPSHGSHSKIRVSNSTSNPSYKPPLSINEYNFNKKLPNDIHLGNQRSFSYEANIHKHTEPEIIHVQFPIGRPVNYKPRNHTVIDPTHVSSAFVRQPPPPPPRDPKRLVSTQHYENGRPNTYYFDNTGQMRSKSLNISQSAAQRHTRNFGSFNLHPSYRSTSEDYLPNNHVTNQSCQRPASTTPETSSSQVIVQKHLNQQSNPENFSYLTDKKPRSRKPIFIQTAKNGSQGSLAQDKSEAQKAIDFWRQKDKEGNSYFQAKDRTVRAGSNSPQMFTCQTHVQTQVFLPSVLQNDINTNSLVNSTDSLVVNHNETSSSPFKPISPNPYHFETSSNSNSENHYKNEHVGNIIEQKEDNKRKSSNLEEALDELEAIYNSLRLGDEDLLERAEQREKDAQAKKFREGKSEAFPSWSTARGALSDSSFSYEPFDSVDSPRRKRLSRRSQTIDRRGDDMAYRKLCKERSSTINDPQSVISNLSYLQASPLYGKDTMNDPVPSHNKNSKEPDVTFDDVVYRNVKYANNSPKVVEPQPPFGIPIGPITLAANSDYLHAVPEDIPRPTFKSRKIPDLVKDDLAFRNLRKDSTREPALPPVSAEDLKNNNANEPKLVDLNSLKKKRAVRSLSANIGSLISKEVLERGLEKHKHNNNGANEFKTLTDIADAMEIARQVLKDKERKISNTRKAFSSDTETNNGGDILSKMSERRLNFLNNLKASSSLNDRTSPINTDHLHSKPPRGLTPERRSPRPRSPKESTPIPVSSLEDTRRSNQETHSSIDDFLTALATETKETNERITKELKDFDDEINRRNGNIDVRKQLSDIDAVSDQAKLCEKLLEGVVDSSDFMISSKSPVEEVEQINLSLPAAQSLANVVVSREESKITDEIVEKALSDSEHDYENLISDKELGVDDPHTKKPTSPFEEQKVKLIASFQELKKNIDLDLKKPVTLKNTSQFSDDELDTKTQANSTSDEDSPSHNDRVTGKQQRRLRPGGGSGGGNNSSGSRLPRWIRPHSNSCGNLSEILMTTTAATSTTKTTMSSSTEGQAEQRSRADRVARYKEERRKQLAAQFGTAAPSSHSDPQTVGNSSTTRKFHSNAKDSASSSEGPRPTRASRLRAAVASTTSSSAHAQQQDNNGSLCSSSPRGGSRLELAEKLTTPVRGFEANLNGSRCAERDKSSKRKSNLNRALNSEEVPAEDSSDSSKNLRRRQRRFFPQEVLDRSTKDSSSTSTNSTTTTTTAKITSHDDYKLTSDTTTAATITTNTATTNNNNNNNTSLTATSSFLSHHPSLSTSTTASSRVTSPRPGTATSVSKKSELSIHMENARKGLTPSYSEMGKYRPFAKRPVPTSSPKDKQISAGSTGKSTDQQHQENIHSQSADVQRHGNTARITGGTATSANSTRLSLSSRHNTSGSDNDSTKINRKMEELKALTKDTLAKVERLASRNKDLLPSNNNSNSTNVNSKQQPMKRPTTTTTAAVSNLGPMKQTTASTSTVVASDSSIVNRTTATTTTTTSSGRGSSQPFSILKKKSFEEPTVQETVPNIANVTVAALPVSILKRKVSSAQDDHHPHNRLEGASTSSTHTPPVTFSPSVIEPATTDRRKQGILKKRRSLDESQVMRHRSCSPDVVHANSSSSRYTSNAAGAGTTGDSRSILKNQRRSSLEELRRTQSPETHLHGILKRKTSRAEEDDLSLNSPQGILKRRSGASSAGSTGSSPHVSITTAVILAAAGGAEMILDQDENFETVKPILKKKKSFSEEHPTSDSYSYTDAPPKPILKKKSSTDTDDCEDKPKPILKMSRNSLDRDHLDLTSSATTADNNWSFSNFNRTNTTSPSDLIMDCDINRSSKKPILRQNSLKEETGAGASGTSRPRLSFCGEPPHQEDYDASTATSSTTNNNASSSGTRYNKNARRSHTISNEFDFASSNANSNEAKEEDRELRKSRPLSVSDLVKSFETSTIGGGGGGSSTGAVPKKSSLKRYSDRYRTQPVTSNELEASLNFVRSPQLDTQFKCSPLRSPEPPPSSTAYSASSLLLNFTSSLENDSNLNSFLLSQSSFNDDEDNTPDSAICGKMSSDSAFQSLGDGLELDQDGDEDVNGRFSPPLSTTAGASGSIPSGVRAARSRLEPGNLELQMRAIAQEAQKIKLGRGNSGASGVHKYRNAGIKSSEKSSSRFSTQPVTFEEVQEAAKINKETAADDSEDDKSLEPATTTGRERKGILKSSSFAIRSRRDDSPPPLPPSISVCQPTRSALKKRSESFTTPSSLSKTRGSGPKIEISDVTYDEGISCNDSDASDSESAAVTTVVQSAAGPTVVARNSVAIEKYSSARSRDDRTLSSRFGGGKYGSGGDTTSDGESSGGREIRSIFKNENKLKLKQTLESVLSKSKSQGTITSEYAENNWTEPEKRKNTTTTTTSIRRSQTQSAMPRSIAELQAKLQQSGESSWRKRLNQSNNSNDELKLLKDKNKYNDELSEKSILALKKDELDAAAEQWKSRVEKTDVEKFSVAGRMVDKEKDGSPLPINIPSSADRNKKKPQAKRFKGKEGSDTSSTPGSPDKTKYPEFARSFSVPDPGHDSSSSSDNSVRSSGRKVSVNRPDDYTFKSFYRSIEEKKLTAASDFVDLSLDDLDSVTRHSLLVQKKNIQVQKRRGASKNPIKALASRTDISNEYTEIITGVAEREKRRLNIEKLAKTSNLAVEALAGLASNEDFKSVALKKSSSVSTMVPFKNVMLLQVKGRRHVQTRLVEPAVSSINEGDSYILVTGNALYNYIGSYSNVIEQSRAADIVGHIQQTGDLGCKVEEAITINELNRTATTKQTLNFWKLLGCTESQTFTEGGNPTEDEIYETNILSTNMIYKLEDNELVPWEEYWGAIPKIEMLESGRVIVFDFGTEMYVWSGKNAPLDQKRRCLKLAKELWDEGFNYTDCSVCPLNVAQILGNRPLEKLAVKGSKRPDWALFAKVTQHRETILFKEKFLDWPDFSRVIRVRSDDSIHNKSVDPSYDIRPCDVTVMLKPQSSEPDLVVQGFHLGRGKTYFDEETRRLFEFHTEALSAWRILENSPEKVTESPVAHFYDGDTYIVKWSFRMTVKGRELTGKPSKYAQVGRDKCIYFYWHGSKASINEKGYAALLTVELDNEKAPQISVVQGSEPAVFLGLFNGSMVVHAGKRDDDRNDGDRGGGGGGGGGGDSPRLFIVKGELEDEVCLVEVPCEASQLRSRSSFVVVDSAEEEILIWHGCKSSQQKRKVTRQAAERIASNKTAEFYLEDAENVEITEIEEGHETQEFIDIVGYNSELYHSLIDDSASSYDYTMRLFHLSSVLGTFNSTEVLCPYRSEYSSPYPFSQNELYSASQPALFLIDNHHELWLWQGWWPETETVTAVTASSTPEEVAPMPVVNLELSDQTGSGAVRWQAERKAAMQTACDYWRRKKQQQRDNNNSDRRKRDGQVDSQSDSDSDATPVRAYLVWAGLEPLEFKNLFPTWVDRDDVTELNLKEGKLPNAKLPVERQLALISRTTYPLAELLQRPLPDGVDPTHLEIYLSPDDFQEFMSMSKEDFRKLPPWKQTAVKKEKGLF